MSKSTRSRKGGPQNGKAETTKRLEAEKPKETIEEMEERLWPPPRPEQAAFIERITKLSNGKMYSEFSPSTSDTDDPGAEGHLYWARVNDGTDDAPTWMYVDDRKDIGPQLISELRRVAGWFLSIADEVAVNIGTQSPSRWQQPSEIDKHEPSF